MSDLQRTSKILKLLAPSIKTLPYLSTFVIEIHDQSAFAVEALLQFHGLSYSAHEVENNYGGKKSLFWVISQPDLGLVFYVKSKPEIPLVESSVQIHDRTPEQILQILEHLLVQQLVEADHDLRYNIHLQESASAVELIDILKPVADYEIKLHKTNDTRWLTIGKNVAIFV